MLGDRTAPALRPAAQLRSDGARWRRGAGSVRGWPARLRRRARSVRACVCRPARARACAGDAMTWQDELATALGARVVAAEPVSGGDINEAFRARLADERVVFVKTRATPLPGMFVAEAAGLEWLGAGPLRVPRVIAVTEALLALEWLDLDDAVDNAAFGRGLAAAAPARRARASASIARASSRRSAGQHPGARRRHPLDRAPVATAVHARAARRGSPARRARAAARAVRPARAAVAPARRSLVGQRRLERRRAGGVRSRGLRRPSRGRPRDAVAVRRAAAGASSRRTRRCGRSRTAGTRGSRCGSSIRSPRTPCCSAAATGSASSASCTRSPDSPSVA